jgi:outer membrane protein
MLAASCTALGPAGRGGWSDELRGEELSRASALANPDPAGPAARDAHEPAFDSSAPRSPSHLDLATALDLAHRHNRNVAASQYALDAVAGGVAIARSRLLPTASVRGAYDWYDEEQKNSFQPDLCATPPCAPVELSVPVREQDFATVSAAVRLAIDLSGQLRHGLWSAQASYRAERARAWATRLQEESAVARAYFGLLEAERLREVGLETVALHERQFSDASSRFELGRLTRNNVLVVEVALIDARQAILQLDNAVAAARRNLNAVTGLEIAAPTTVLDIREPPDLPPLESAVEAVSSRNPLVTSMLEEVAAADERLTAERRARFPRFDAHAGYDATTQSLLQPNDYPTVGVRMEADLYSLEREGEIARLAASATRSRLLLDRTRRDVEALVRASHDQLRERILAIEAISAAVRQAEENRRIRQVQFDEGRATSEDLLDASQILTRQRALLASAIYQSHVRRAELQELMGEPLSNLSEASGIVPGASPAAGVVPGAGPAGEP